MIGPCWKPRLSWWILHPTTAAILFGCSAPQVDRVQLAVGRVEALMARVSAEESSLSQDTRAEIEAALPVVQSALDALSNGDPATADHVEALRRLRPLASRALAEEGLTPAESAAVLEAVGLALDLLELSR